MKIIDCIQHSDKWLEARAGLPTASELHNLLTPAFKEKDGETPITYLAQKLAEKWIGGPLLDFCSFATDFGNIIEKEAAPWYEFTQDVDSVQTCVFLTTDDGKFGCSPDGIVKKGNLRWGLEIKSLQPKAHFKCLIEQKIPKDYITQVHASMFATGFDRWDFLAYRRDTPNFLITVERDEKIIEAIRAKIAAFTELLEEKFAAIKSLP